jgi:hypothetical protein
VGIFAHASSSPRPAFAVWPLKVVGGGAWQRRLLVLLFDALPCAAGVPRWHPAHCLRSSGGTGAQAQRGTGLPRMTNARTPGRHTCLDAGRAHPFPQASCEMEYAGGGNGVERKGDISLRIERIQGVGWDVYPHNWMAPAWTAPSTTSWSPSPASQGRNQKRRPGSSPVYGGGGPCAAWWRGRPGSPFDLANAVDSRDKPENDGRTSASPTKKRGQGLAFHSSGTSPNLTAPPPASSAG